MSGGSVHEPVGASRVRPGPLLAVAAILVGGACLLLLAADRLISDRIERTAVQSPSGESGEGGEEFSGDAGGPSPGRAEIEALVAKRLGSYGWVDRNAGITHIPIERALALIAERGLPAPTPAQPAPGPLESAPAETPPASEDPDDSEAGGR